MTSQNERSWKSGPLYTGSILGLPRWKFWQKGFAAAVESSRASEECRQLAQKAVDYMDATERVNTW
ncbi:hypothetical protein NUU61_008366 [Penicillium alfredii]|uniref:Uncharacterized protein n=1 Tax=Penicillium alfredii TaxID=1506179 RepID=A0A9W9JYZ7_9EURO|nr:uncharacterized protein NUU61_008366 [Penicillium alfredii]KAJ5087059.1 hypothetical protein NUU61_008366 [Penicillium alfredii]